MSLLKALCKLNVYTHWLTAFGAAKIYYFSNLYKKIKRPESLPLIYHQYLMYCGFCRIDFRPFDTEGYKKRQPSVKVIGLPFGCFEDYSGFWNHSLNASSLNGAGLIDSFSLICSLSKTSILALTSVYLGL